MNARDPTPTPSIISWESFTRHPQQSPSRSGSGHSLSGQSPSHSLGKPSVESSSRPQWELKSPFLQSPEMQNRERGLVASRGLIGGEEERTSDLLPSNAMDHCTQETILRRVSNENEIHLISKCNDSIRIQSPVGKSSPTSPIPLEQESLNGTMALNGTMDNRIPQLVDGMLHMTSYLWRSTILGLASQFLEPQKRRRKTRCWSSIDNSTLCLGKMQHLLVFFGSQVHLMDQSTRISIAATLILQLCAFHLEPLWKGNLVSLGTLIGFAFRYVATLEISERSGLFRFERMRRQIETQLRAILVELVLCVEQHGARISSLFCGAEIAEQTILCRVGYLIDHWDSEDVILQRVVSQGFLSAS